MSTTDEIKALKGRGWLVNKGGETFSARVVTVNGKMTTEQMQVLAAAAQKFGRGELTLTSRMSRDRAYGRLWPARGRFVRMG